MLVDTNGSDGMVVIEAPDSTIEEKNRLSDPRMSDPTRLSDLRMSDPTRLSDPNAVSGAKVPDFQCLASLIERKSENKEMIVPSDASGVLKYGTLVRRGPDWDRRLYKYQDAGPEGLFSNGIVLSDTALNNWAPVKWRSTGRVYFYRWGVRALLSEDRPMFDLQIVMKQARHIDFTGISTAQILRRIVYPRWVGFKLDVLRVGDICTVNQCFQVDLHLTMTWKAGPYDNYLYLLSKKNPLWEPRWQPRIYFPNAKQVETYEYVVSCDSRKYTTVYVGNELWITVKLDVELILTEIFEMQSFPFDCQDLTLEIQSRDPIDKIKLVPLPQIREDYLPEKKNETMQFLNVRRSTFTDQEWKFKNTILEIRETNPEDNAFGAKFSKVIVRFKLKRLWMMYLFRVLIVLSLLSFGSLSSFFVDYKNVGERLNLGVAFVLTTVAFLLVVSQWTPKIPYLTILDKYALSVLLFMLLILLESAVHSGSSNQESVVTQNLFSVSIAPFPNTSKTYSVDDSETSASDNMWMMIFGICLSALHIFFMVWAYILRGREVRKLLSSSTTLEYTGVERRMGDLKITWEKKDKNVYQALENVKAGWFHRATSTTQVEVPPLTIEFFHKRFTSDVVIFVHGAVDPNSSMSKIVNLGRYWNCSGLEQIRQILTNINIEFQECDVSGKMPGSQYKIYQAVQASSGLMEFPQVYVRGHFHGGVGKIKELERTNNLAHSILEGSDLEDHMKSQLLLAFKKGNPTLEHAVSETYELSDGQTGGYSP